MARTNPLGKIKDLTVETLKSPRTAAGRAVHQAKDAAAAGLTVADHVTRSAVATVGTLVQQRKGGASPSSAPRPADQPTETTAVDTSEPVNVVEELGLDPAPVDESATPESKDEPKTEPETEIDAAADPASVEATPADVAEKVATKPRKAPVTEAPARKTTPSGKLPPRKTTEETAAKKTADAGSDEG